MKFIYNYTKEELENSIEPKFRAKQIYSWLYKKYVNSFENMKNIPNALKGRLSSEFEINPLKSVNIQLSKDGTKKYLFRLRDSHTIETVLIKMSESRYSVCISTQVGCKVGCSFCSTAKGGFVRNLEPAEIVAQVIELKRDNLIPENRTLNIVYMGMGEPLDNFDNLVKAIKILSELDGLSISPRRQTISTSGISSKIEKLGELKLGVHIAISLHAVDDKLREKLIPMNRAYNINSIIEAVKKYPIDNRKRVMFEYLVIKDLNDDLNSAKKLVKLLSGVKAKVNLIYFNSYLESEFQTPTQEQVKKFQEYLLSKNLLCTVRESKGSDIDAACGQLREKELKNGSS